MTAIGSSGKHSYHFLILATSVIAAVLLSSCSPIPFSPTAEPARGQALTNLSSTPVPTEEGIQFLADNDPAEIDNSLLPVTPLANIHLTGSPQDIDIASYHFTVDGQVDNPLSLTYEELLQYPEVTETVLLICPGFFVDNAEWTGVPLSTLLKEAKVTSGATIVTFYGIDGYEQTLPLDTVLQDGVFLAYKVDGQTLPKEHGYPLRLVAKGTFGGAWIKWLSGISVS